MMPGDILYKRIAGMRQGYKEKGCFPLFRTIVLTLFFPLILSQAALAQELPEPPQFSHEAGFYDSEFQLHITHPRQDAVIYYTLDGSRSEEHTSELQSRGHLVCRLLLEKI